MKTNTHIVIKREDIFKYLTDNQIMDFDAILDIIASGRRKEGKKAVNSYYICNTDEPYADEVLEVILKNRKYCDRCKKEFEKWNHKRTELIGVGEIIYDNDDPYFDKKNLCESCYDELEKWWNFNSQARK